MVLPAKYGADDNGAANAATAPNAEATATSLSELDVMLSSR